MKILIGELLKHLLSLLLLRMDIKSESQDKMLKEEHSLTDMLTYSIKMEMVIITLSTKPSKILTQET